MCESVSKVTGINVEILGRRLSFTYEEAVALKGVLQDAFGETIVERVVPPMYGPTRDDYHTWPFYTPPNYWGNSTFSL